MRRGFLYLTLLLGIWCQSSQTAKAQGFKWGVRDGVTVSHLVGIDNTLPRVGFYVGAFAGYHLSDHFALWLEVDHSEQGVSCRPNDDGISIDYNYNYLNIPLLAEFAFNLGGGHQLSILAGAQAGLFLLGTYDYLAPSVLGDGNVAGEGRLDRADFHPVDFGVALGAEWSVGNYALELRYTLGITQTHDGISNTLNGYYYISVPDNRNSVLQVGTKFYF